MGCQWKDKILTTTEQGFDELALDIFWFQYENNSIYHQYIKALQIDPATVGSVNRIPFLPIQFFKTHTVKTTAFEPAIIFESSGTTGSINSQHFVKSTTLYKHSFIKSFESFYGSVNDWCILGLLPSYLERQNSSLVYMVNELIGLSGHEQSGFYLDEFEQLFNVLTQLEKKKQKTLLIGVTFGLLDFAEAFSSRICPGLFNHTIVMETGGMKGRRVEMVRQQIHAVLKKSFHLPFIHSEYGMTELLSQAWSKGGGIFNCPPWMKIVVRDEEDPLHIKQSETGQPTSGAINIIDLANVYSCSFIATSDAGRVFPDGSFEVLGRMDNSDLRGCSLLVV
jgi:hypothetical protein